MSTLADSGAVALEAIVVASIVVPALILAGVCWVFYRARSAKTRLHVRGGRASIDNTDTSRQVPGIGIRWWWQTKQAPVRARPSKLSAIRP
jgi:hypothetical protein